MISSVADLNKFMLDLHKDMDQEMLETVQRLRQLEKDFPSFKVNNDKFEQHVNNFVERRTEYENRVNEHAFNKAQEIIKQ